MTTWHDMAKGNRTAAHELFAAGRWRSAASRAYYAVYSDATRALLQAGVTMPVGRGNPTHHALSVLVVNNLAGLSLATRWRLASLTSLLYKYRVIGDYQPRATLDEKDARLCLGLMTQSFECLRNLP